MKEEYLISYEAMPDGTDSSETAVLTLREC